MSAEATTNEQQGDIDGQQLPAHEDVGALEPDDEPVNEANSPDKPRRGRPPSVKGELKATSAEAKPQDNKVVKLLDKTPLGMTLPEMAGGPRQIKRIKTLRPLLAEAIRSGLVMPVSQRAGHTVYRLVKHIANR